MVMNLISVIESETTYDTQIRCIMHLLRISGLTSGIICNFHF